jgi:AcrR family transcriptional regulator
MSTDGRAGRQGVDGSEAVPAWLRPLDSAPRRRRRSLDREQIVQAAIRVVDAEGIAALTMRRLAVELDAGATSVYRHVRDRGELLDLALDAVTAELALPAPGTAWREALQGAAHGLRALFRRHPNFMLVRATRVALGPRSLAALEHMLGILRAAGFSDRDTLYAASTVVNYTLGFTLFELLPLLQLEAEGRDPAAYLQLMGSFVGGLPVQQFPNLVALAPLVLGREEDEFAYGVAALIRGFEAAGPSRSP